MTYKITAIVLLLVMGQALSYAEKFALSCLAGSVRRIGWIDRAARLALLFSDLCLVAFAALVAHTLAVVFDLHFVLSVVPIQH